MKDLAGLLRRIAVTVVGTVILAVGVVLLVAPGPGLLVILLALIVFAVEYEWARRHLTAVRARARSAADKAAASHVATASAVLFGAGAIGLGAVLIFTDVLPLSGATVTARRRLCQVLDGRSSQSKGDHNKRAQGGVAGANRGRGA